MERDGEKERESGQHTWVSAPAPLGPSGRDVPRFGIKGGQLIPRVTVDTQTLREGSPVEQGHSLRRQGSSRRCRWRALCAQVHGGRTAKARSEQQRSLFGWNRELVHKLGEIGGWHSREGLDCAVALQPETKASEVGESPPWHLSVPRRDCLSPSSKYHQAKSPCAGGRPGSPDIRELPDVRCRDRHLVWH